MTRFCPKCDSEMERIPYDPDVGILYGGWFCHECEESHEDEGDDYDD